MSVARLLFAPALLLAMPAMAKVTNTYGCGGAIKLQNLNKMKRDRAMEAIRDAERSTLDTGTGTTLTTERLERYKQGLGWFGIGAVHPGTFEYHLDYDAAGTGQFTLAVRDFYGPLAPGDLTLSIGARA